MDRAELIKQLRELAELTPPICQQDNPFEADVMGKTATVYCKPFEQFQELVKQAAAALREQERNEQDCAKNAHCNEWISVKERLPEGEVDVLARCYYNANWCLQVCHLSHWIKGNWFTSVAGQRVEASHWMPLPEPPKENRPG